MKKPLIALVIVGIGALAVQAAPAKTDPPKACGSCCKTATTKTALTTKTGSSMPRRVDVSGRITDGPYPLVVVSSETIQRSGRSTVGGVLASQGLRR